MIKKLTALVLFVALSLPSFADEGMWLPMFIKRLNHTDMQKMGLKLTADEIYSVNNASLKDAIVHFNGGCTGEIISKDGLLLTNHHCGYESIQSHSTVQNDYLTDGFWSMKRTEEKSNPGMVVSFLVRMEDVTAQVAKELTPTMTEVERNEKLKTTFEKLQAEAVKGTHYTAVVKDFFDGNEFYMFVYETYKDIRLVGAPPSSIGKFGGDTDNWMWPRHTGDFSLFRVYTGPDGKPADYSPNNIPLKPKKYLPISLKGIKQGDFSMVFGYPGTTDRYLTSYGVKVAVEKSNPARVKVRDKKLALMREDMEASKEIRIKYASKYARISNYWKYFIGQTQILNRLKVADQKRAEEVAFQKWANADPARKAKYGQVLANIEEAYKKYDEYVLSSVYRGEAGLGAEIIQLAARFQGLNQALATPTATDAITKQAEGVKAYEEDYFKDYNLATDKKIFAATMKLFYEGVPKAQQPDIFKTVETQYQGDFNKFADHVFSNSFLTEQSKVESFLKAPSAEVLAKDPAYQVMQSIMSNYSTNILPKLIAVEEQLRPSNRLYVAGVREMNPTKKYYPNANSTLRLTYGKVGDYIPRDAVKYMHYTTLEGIMEKEDASNEEFVVPQKLKELYKNKDYGQYAHNGKLPVGFITNNDITGGNSGSPVIDGEGNLIGCAFDGNWEAMSGAIAFEPQLQRCINVDIRYILFIIDKYAGAKHLIDEMTIVKTAPADNKPK